MIKHSEHYNDQIKFWSLLSNSLMNAKEYARKVNNLDVIELTELTSWTKKMSSTAKKLFDNSIEPRERTESLAHIFQKFMDGKVLFLSKNLRCIKLSKSHQKMFSNKICSNIEEIDCTNKILTHINKILHSYVSVIFNTNSILLICTSNESTSKSHIKDVSGLLNDHLEIEFSDITTEVLDLIIELDNQILEETINHICNLKSHISIRLYLIDELGNIAAFKLLESVTTETCFSIPKLSSFDGKSIRQCLKELFAPERTFSFSKTSGANWAKQVRKANELLNFFIEIEKIFLKNSVSNQPQRGKVVIDIQNAIRKAFDIWETLKRHSSNPDYLGTLPAEDLINCLEFISKDRLGYLLHFNFDRIKGKVENGNIRKFKISFIERFTILRHGASVVDRWQGIIYDNIGKFGDKNSDKSNKYVFRIRNNVKSWESIFRKKILKDLEHIALTDLRKLNKYFNNESFQFLKSIWISAGYETPEKLLKSFVNDENNPLKILKEVEVKFRVINGVDLLNKEFVKKNPEFKFDFFKELYSNSKLIDKACRSRTITETIIEKGKAYSCLSKRTKNDVPIPRYSKSNGLVFFNITNENENAAAVRVFLDLLTNNDKCRKLLKEIGLLSQENYKALVTKKAKFILDWEKGIKTAIIDNQIAGLPDGIVAIKRGKRYYDEFFVEMTGLNKSKQSYAYLISSSPFSSVIGDLLRIACNGAAGKPGLVVFGQVDITGDIVYTIVKFDDFVISRLKNAGTHFAVDINRPKVKMILNEGILHVKNRLKKVFYDISTLDLRTDLYKFSLESPTNLELYHLFYNLVKICLNIKVD